jgi:CrcB protein
VTTRLPVGTLAVNVLGCFFIGVLANVLTESALVRPEYRMAILVGFLGGFTTFSTYAWETLSVGQGGFIGAALLNILLSNGLGLLAVWLGWRLSHGWPGV